VQIWQQTASEETPRGAHDLSCCVLNILFSREPDWDPVTGFCVQARQPGMDHRGIRSFGGHPEQLEGEPQTLFGITVELASAHSPVAGAHLLDSTGRGGELAADWADELCGALGDGDANRLTVRAKIRARFGNRGH
jgi:hypothetical protein